MPIYSDSECINFKTIQEKVRQYGQVKMKQGVESLIKGQRSKGVCAKIHPLNYIK